ncbi:MAG: hypothetical protein HZA70_07485 [Planctomycetes bacterium]|nr:hypothetical protein [Planctomycetota bacterium]
MSVVKEVSNMAYGSVRRRAILVSVSVLLSAITGIVIESFGLIEVREGLLAFILPIPIFIILIVTSSYLGTANIPAPASLGIVRKKVVKL